MIIKPLNTEYELVQLGVTSIESALHPPEFIATPEQLFEASTMGHACGSIIQHTALGDGLGGAYANKMYIKMLSYLQNGSERAQTFYKNLCNGNIVTIGQRYQGIIMSETPLYLRIEAGKYLIFIKSGGIDMAGLSDEGGVKIVYDNKLYSKYYKDENKNNMGTMYKNTDKEQEIKTKEYDGKIYTVEEVMRAELGEKIQRWMYPLMVGFGNKDYMYFQYNIIVKNTAKTKNLMPNVQEIKIKVTKKEAEKLCKNVIVEVFKNHIDKETLSLKKQ